MISVVRPGSLLRSSPSKAALRAAARFWLVVAVIGLWTFVYYVATFYGGAAVQGQLENWNRVLPNGYAPGDLLGTFSIGTHVFLAVVIILGGPLQLVPLVRTRYPTFHRWNGRSFMLAACLASIAGLYLVWIRGGTAGGFVQHLGISLDAVLILSFSVIAFRYALARDFSTHRRWALRLFMVVNAVWFFRIGLMFWLFVHGRPVGFDPVTFEGPFLNFLSFAQTLLPLAVLELYLRAKDCSNPVNHWAMAGGLFLLTIAMGVGIFAAIMGLWLPLL